MESTSGKIALTGRLEKAEVDEDLGKRHSPVKCNWE